MPITRGSPYGEPGPLPDDGVVVRSDAEARSMVEEARRAGRPVPVLGLLAGDLCRTLGGTGDEGRLRSHEAVRFPVDLAEVLLDDRLHWFVAHLVARSRGWRRALVAMNAQFLGSWVLGPRAHVYRADLSLPDRLKVRSRLRHGAHLPHPGIEKRRTAHFQVDLGRPLPVALDGQALGEVRNVSLRVEPDAVTVVV